MVVASRGPLDCPRGLSTWTNPDILGNSCQKAAPSSPFVLWGTPRTVNERSDARSGLLAHEFRCFAVALTTTVAQEDMLSEAVAGFLPRPLHCYRCVSFTLIRKSVTHPANTHRPTDVVVCVSVGGARARALCIGDSFPHIARVRTPARAYTEVGTRIVPPHPNPHTRYVRLCSVLS